MLGAVAGPPLLACEACARVTSPSAALLVGAMMLAPLLAMLVCALVIRAERRT